MSIFIHSQTEDKPIPGGGVPQSILDTLARIETDISTMQENIARLENLKASLTGAGLVKLSNATDVTDSTGLALPATEKNAAIEGTLGNLVKKARDKADGIVGAKLIYVGSGLNKSNCNDLVSGESALVYNSAENYPDATYPFFLVYTFGNTTIGNYRAQIAIATHTMNAKMLFRNIFEGGIWTPWVAIKNESV